MNLLKLASLSLLMLSAAACEVTSGDGLEFGDVRAGLSTIDYFATFQVGGTCEAPNVRVVIQRAGGWRVSVNDGTNQFGPMDISELEVDAIAETLSNMPQGNCKADSCDLCGQQSLTVNGIAAFRECCGPQNTQFEADFDEVAMAMRAYVP